MPTRVVDSTGHELARFGQIEIKQSSDPAANTEISYTADEDMIILNAVVRLVTDANAANRRVKLQAADTSGNVFFLSTARVDQVASTTIDYMFCGGATTQSGIHHSTIEMYIPPEGLRLKKGDVISTATLNRQVGDNYGVLTMQVQTYS